MSLKINFTKVIINKEFIRGRLELVNDTDYTLNKLKINIELLNGDIHAHTLKENSDTDIKPRSKKVWLVEDLYKPSFIYNKFNPHIDIEKASNSKG